MNLESEDGVDGDGESIAEQRGRGIERKRAAAVYGANTAQTLGRGGQTAAERELGWSQAPIRIGMHELASGLDCIDAANQRGLPCAAAHLPNLLSDIKAIVDSQSQTAPQFRSRRLSTRLTAAAVRRQLIAQKGYVDDQLPQAQTIGKKLNGLGYYPRKVAKSRPQKRLPPPAPSSIN